MRPENSARPTHAARLKALSKRYAPLALALGAGLIWYVGHDASGPGSARTAPVSGVRDAAAGRPSAGRGTTVGELTRPIVPQQAGIGSTIEVIVARNDTLDGIFRRMSLDTADLAAIRQLPGIRQSLDFLKPGDSIKVTHNDGEIRELTRRVNETQTLKVMRKEDGFAAKMIDDPVETRVRTATAGIESSLFQAADAAGISDTVATKLAGIFAWDIDFALDIREGDRFTVVYEQIYRDGRYLRDGDVLAAQFVNAGRVYRAVRFVSETGSTGYYTPDGQPVRKAFLRAPVEFTRVSSVFNPHRRHPILNLIRGHMGTDYAAPTGTPVHAAGEGRVSFAGQRGGYGNAIVIAHSSSVSTLYGHMSRFASNLRTGTHVQQGTVIGYVGMTGLATGPHLHYEYLVNGVHKNPQTVRLVGAEPLHAEALLKFRRATASLLADLAHDTPAVTAAAPTTAAPAMAAGPLAADEKDSALLGPPIYGAEAPFSPAALIADGTLDRLYALSAASKPDQQSLNLAARPSHPIN